MKRIIKIVIAAILAGSLIFIGITSYMEHKQREENVNSALMDLLIEKNETENAEEKIVYTEVTEVEKKEKIEEYISRIFLDVPGKAPLIEVSDIDEITEEYIERLVYLNCDLVEPDNKNVTEENGEYVEKYYSYPELNRVIVKLLGKEMHNKLPNKSGYYFEKTTDGFCAIGMCGSESISKHYVIDKIRLANNGLYYVDMYEYTKEYEVIGPDITIDDAGTKLNILDVNEKKVYDYTLDVIPYSEIDVTIKYLDSENNEVTDEMMEEDVKENLDKFVKRTIILEYDEELDLFYMKSNSLEK